MSSNEYLYLGKLVMAALEKEGSLQLYDKPSDGYCCAVVGPRVWRDQRGPAPIAALEAALTALEIPLPERGPWTVYDGANPPETGRDCWVTISSPWGKKVYKMFWQGGQWYGVTTINATEMAAEYGVEAWYYAEERPEPYQEATS